MGRPPGRKFRYYAANFRPDQVAALQARAKEMGASVQSVIRDAIDAGLPVSLKFEVMRLRDEEAQIREKRMRLEELLREKGENDG